MRFHYKLKPAANTEELGDRVVEEMNALAALPRFCGNKSSVFEGFRAESPLDFEVSEIEIAVAGQQRAGQKSSRSETLICPYVGHRSMPPLRAEADPAWASSPLALFERGRASVPGSRLPRAIYIWSPHMCGLLDFKSMCR